MPQATNCHIEFFSTIMIVLWCLCSRFILNAAILRYCNKSEGNSNSGLHITGKLLSLLKDFSQHRSLSYAVFANTQVFLETGGT